MKENIEMVLLKNCAMGKAGTEIIVHSQGAADYFIKAKKARLKTGASEEKSPELPKEEPKAEAATPPKTAAPKKQTKK